MRQEGDPDTDWVDTYTQGTRFGNGDTTLRMQNSTDLKALSWTFTPVPRTKDTLDKETDGPYLG